MKKLTLISLTLSLLFLSGAASATHKSWLLKHSGAACVWSTPTANDRLGIAYLFNYGTSIRGAECWGSNGPAGYNFSAKRWAAVRAATVYAQRQGAGNLTVSCSAWMRTANGSSYYSQTVNNTGNIGMATLKVAEQQVGGNGTGWGGTLEANETLTPTALAFHCAVPASTAILGYKMQTCQLNEDCYDGDDPESSNFDGVWGSWIQTSGIECTQATDAPSRFSRSSAGFVSSTGSFNKVFCPFAPPADDTYESNRKVRYTTVRYSGGSTSSTCLTDGTCPSCRLMWFGREGIQSNTGAFPKDPAGRRMSQVLEEISNLGREVNVGVECSVPGGVTIEGVTAYMTRTGVTDGGT
jgi:hypothetical protein